MKLFCFVGSILPVFQQRKAKKQKGSVAFCAFISTQMHMPSSFLIGCINPTFVA